MSEHKIVFEKNIDDLLEKLALENKFSLKKKEIFEKEHPEKYENFVGEHYIGYLFEKEI